MLIEFRPNLLNNNMPQPYTFSTTLLSGAKFSPKMTGQSLSASGVSIVSLSTLDMGLAFTPNTVLTGTLVNTTVQGSVFNIDSSYHLANSQMALVKEGSGGFTIFQFASGGSVGVALSSGHRSVSTSETRRKRNLGY